MPREHPSGLPDAEAFGSKFPGQANLLFQCPHPLKPLPCGRHEIHPQDASEPMCDARCVTGA